MERGSSICWLTPQKAHYGQSWADGKLGAVASSGSPIWVQGREDLGYALLFSQDAELVK